MDLYLQNKSKSTKETSFHYLNFCNGNLNRRHSELCRDGEGSKIVRKEKKIGWKASDSDYQRTYLLSIDRPEFNFI